MKIFGIFELHLAAMGEISLSTSGELSASVMVGGGITIGLYFVKASFYVQGTAKITGKVPSALKKPLIALKWMLVKWAEKSQESSAFARVVKKLGSKAAEKLEKVATSVRNGLKTPSPAEKTQGDDGSFDVSKLAAEKIAEAANEKYLALFKEYRDNAGAILAVVQKQKDEPAKLSAYQDEFEKLWRGVYVNDKTVACTGVTCTRPKCTKIKGTVTPIMPLMCSFFKYGALTASDNDPSKGNANTKKMFPLVYPEIFPAKAADVEKLLAAVKKRTEAYATAIAGAKDNDQKKRREERLSLKVTSNLPLYDMYAAGLTPLLALEPAALKTAVTDLAAGAQAEDCEKSCGCGVQEVTLEGLMGLTFGSGAVGFCTPDTNPLQWTSGTTYVMKKQLEGTTCKLKKSDDSGTTMTLTIAGSSYLAAALSWKYDADMKYLGKVIEVRFRLPFEQPKPEAKEAEVAPAKTLAEKFQALVTKVEDAQGTPSKAFEGSISEFFKGIFDEVKTGKGTAGGFLMGLTSQAGSKAATGVLNFVTKALAKESAKVAKALLPANVEVENAALIGFDFEFSFVTKKPKFSLDYLKYTKAAVSANVQPGINLGVEGFYLEGVRMEIGG